MPHQCTECGRTFPDGSKEMLSGCPDCGGNKFQFRPAGTSSGPEDEPHTASAGSDPMGTDDPDSAGVGTSDSTDAGAPDATVDGSERNANQTSDPEPKPDPTTTPDASDPSPSDASDPPPSDASDPSPSDPEDSDPTPAEGTSEDTAQASARSDVVSPDELDRAANETPPTAGDDFDEPAGSEEATGSEERTGPRPDVDELRDELNEQFESIKIVSPGKYELNLMELYDRQEYIISLQEDGRYVIEMPDAWGVSDE